MTRQLARTALASGLVLCSARHPLGGTVLEPEGFSADPEAAAASLLAAITSGLSVAREPRAVRQQFEEELRGVVRAQSVTVGPSSGAVVGRPEVLTFDVPAGPWAPPARLEAVFESNCPVSEWQRRTLALAAPVAALIVRMEEGGPWSRLARIDGAAPLIGSSQAIRRVRERIERVAVTDFTALIEGGIGPQPHPDFIAVFRQAALG